MVKPADVPNEHARLEMLKYLISDLRKKKYTVKRISEELDITQVEVKRIIRSLDED